MDGYEKTEEVENTDYRSEVFTKAVRAGRRTYFFDVKATKNEDYYITITESKKRFSKEGKMFFEKHKIFLYKEDFDKFADGLTEVVAKIRELQPESMNFESNFKSTLESDSITKENVYTDVEFEDLEVKG